MFTKILKFSAVLALLVVLSIVFVSLAMADEYPTEPTGWTIGEGHEKYTCPAGWQTLAEASHETSTPENPLFSGTYPADGQSIFGGWDDDPKPEDELGGHGFLLRLITYIVDPQDPNDDEHPYWSNIFSVRAGEAYAGFTGDDSGQIVVCFQAVTLPVKAVTSGPQCEVPGEQNDNLVVSGLFTIDGVGHDGDTVVLKIDGQAYGEPTVTANGGNYSFTLIGARPNLIGKTVTVTVDGVTSAPFVITSEMFDECNQAPLWCPGEVSINFDWSNRPIMVPGRVVLPPAGNAFHEEVPTFVVDDVTVGYKVWDPVQFVIYGRSNGSVWVQAKFEPADGGPVEDLYIINYVRDEDGVYPPGMWGTVSCWENHTLEIVFKDDFNEVMSNPGQFIHEAMVSLAELLGIHVGEITENLYYDEVSFVSNVIATGDTVDLHIRPRDGVIKYGFKVGDYIAQEEGGNTFPFRAEDGQPYFSGSGEYHVTGYYIMENGETVSAGENGVLIYVDTTPEAAAGE